MVVNQSKNKTTAKSKSIRPLKSQSQSYPLVTTTRNDEGLSVKEVDSIQPFSNLTNDTDLVKEVINESILGEGDSFLTAPAPSETSEGKWLRLSSWNNGAHLAAAITGYSCVYPLRRWNSEPRFTQQHQLPNWGMEEQRMGKSKTMEDIILSRSCYPALVKENILQAEVRTYEISKSMGLEWEALIQLENQRFSFFDELFAKGYVVDSLEVPSRMDDISNFVEADVSNRSIPIDYGRMVFKSKTVFTGNLCNWYFRGPGRYAWLDGTLYQGEFLDGLMHGEGILLLPDGCSYEGQFTNGERAGWGTYTTPTGLMYVGNWLNGLPDSNGRLWLNSKDNDADYQDGNWVKGVMHGYGIRQYGNGDRYIGNFQNGVRKGKGTMIWLAERQVYKGEWTEGQPNGFGEHSWYMSRTPTSPYAERNFYKGEFVNSQRHGIGRMIYACGSIYDGSWQHGVKHGKGIFINSSGEALFAIFRHGSIAGGTDVPLHRASYDCKFDSLVTVLQLRLRTTNPVVALLEEEYLSETVTRFLCQIRSLYKRAGYLGEWWGNQGHYPSWMKKQHSAQHHLSQRQTNIRFTEPIQNQIYEASDEMDEPWLLGHKPHFGSPDHVNPVTRFGLWLLLKDCPGILEDIRLAELDNIWSIIPSISFQTRHHPFEPVQLWQFIQCLVAVSSMLYIEIPKRNYHDTTNVAESEDPFEDNPEDAVRVDKKYPSKVEIETKETSKPQEEKRSNSKARGSVIDSKVLSSELNSDNSKNKSGDGKVSVSTKMKKRMGAQAETLQTKGKTNGVQSKTNRKKVEERTVETQTEKKYKIPKNSENAQTDLPYEDEVPIRDFMLSEAFELFLTDFLIPCLEQRPGKYLPSTPNPLPTLSDLYAAFNVISPYHDVISARDFLITTLHNYQVPSQGAICWTRSRNLVTPDISMEDFFNHFNGSDSTDEDNHFLDYDFLSEKLSNPEIFLEEMKREDFGTEMKHHRKSSIKIFGSGNLVFGNQFESRAEEQDAGDGDNADYKKSIGSSDYIDNLPLGEEDLTPVPFLWMTDAVCTQAAKNVKILDNVKPSDALRILRQLYPKACDRTNVVNLEFNLTFGDWLWLTTGITKLSTDREFCAWMNSESTLEHKHGPCRQQGNQSNDVEESLQRLP